jgi:protein tyrosine phosphatase (PTP) superfamily phosphohydrolase (DUF442 family)
MTIAQISTLPSKADVPSTAERQNTFLINSEPSLELLANVPSTNMIQQVADFQGRIYTFVALRQTSQNANLDYTATSVGASPHCQVVTKHYMSEHSILVSKLATSATLARSRELY